MHEKEERDGETKEQEERQATQGNTPTQTGRDGRVATMKSRRSDKEEEEEVVEGESGGVEDGGLRHSLYYSYSYTTYLRYSPQPRLYTLVHSSTA